MAQRHMTADDVAELFIARIGDGDDMRLTKKQVDWLMSLYSREAYAWWNKNGQQGLPPSPRKGDGLWSGGSWSLDVLRYGAGILRVRRYTREG